MLNTIMAVWNRDHGENRQRVVKVVFTILFISGSASLFLFILNSSAWPPFAGAQEQQTKREEQPTMSNSRGIVIAGNTSVAVSGTVGTVVTVRITPIATVVMAKPLCVQTPAAVKPQRTPATPQNVVVYSGKSTLKTGNSGPKHVPPKTVHVKKGKPHSKVKVNASPISHATKTVPIAPPVLPTATPIIQPTAVPVPTVEVIATITPADTTPVSDMPAIVTTNATPVMSATSSTQFTSSVRQKGALQTSVSPPVKSGQKSSDKKNNDAHKNVECRKSTTHGDNSKGVKIGRHTSLLLRSSLLGTLLLYCFAFVFKREE